MTYQQAPPALGNQYEEDRVLRSFLRRALPDDVRADIEDDLMAMGALAGGRLYRMQRADRLREPVHTPYDAWGHRIDTITLTPLWQEAERLAAEHGLVAIPYEQKHGRHARLHQFALVHLFTPSTDLYSCPLAMTDGAARALLASGNNSLLFDALPHLTSRNPEYFWTSGQWMTELPGGSDVSRTETTARRDAEGTWRLYGRKWFTSAINSQMALTLARPKDNPAGSEGLALFYVELRDAEGRLQNIRVERLKDKLGTRKVPTAELTLDGTPAQLVHGLKHGIRAMAPMLNVTRVWNAVSAVALMRRGLALARDYATKREAFGEPLARLPLHADTLAGLQAVYEGAFHLSFRVAELLGASEATDFGAAASGTRQPLLRVLTPLAKLTTGKQAVTVASEVLEAFGGAGYVEDTGLPVLLRDAQVLPIWEGTTNVLALDVLRALDAVGGLEVLREEIRRCGEGVRSSELAEIVHQAEATLDETASWIAHATVEGRPAVEAGARRFALALGHALEQALLAHHAQWSLDAEDDARAAVAARRLATDAPLPTFDLDATFALANDTPLPAAALQPRATVPDARPSADWGDGAPVE